MRNPHVASKENLYLKIMRTHQRQPRRSSRAAAAEAPGDRVLVRALCDHRASFPGAPRRIVPGKADSVVERAVCRLTHWAGLLKDS